MSPRFDILHTTDRGCVGDQPQQAAVSMSATSVNATGIPPFLRLVCDTASVQSRLPAPVK